MFFEVQMWFLRSDFVWDQADSSWRRAEDWGCSNGRTAILSSDGGVVVNLVG